MLHRTDDGQIWILVITSEVTRKGMIDLLRSFQTREGCDRTIKASFKSITFSCLWQPVHNNVVHALFSRVWNFFLWRNSSSNPKKVMRGFSALMENLFLMKPNSLPRSSLRVWMWCHFDQAKITHMRWRESDPYFVNRMRCSFIKNHLSSS